MNYLESTFGYLIRRAQVAVFKDIFNEFGEQAISLAQFSVLAVVADNPGVSQAELARALCVERPRMVPLVGELEKRGLAERRPSPTDGRARQIFLTKAGTERLTDLKARFEIHQKRLEAKIGKDDADQFRRTLLKIIGPA